MSDYLIVTMMQRQSDQDKQINKKHFSNIELKNELDKYLFYAAMATTSNHDLN